MNGTIVMADGFHLVAINMVIVQLAMIASPLYEDTKINKEKKNTVYSGRRNMENEIVLYLNSSSGHNGDSPRREPL
jgi:hypothetical protein